MRAKRSEMMLDEIEAVALRLFDERSFAEVTVEEIAREAGVSARTFYRYFVGKDAVLQRRIVRNSEALQAALSARPFGEPPLRSVRFALQDVLSGEDEGAVRRWIAILIATPSVVQGVLGAIQLHSQPVLAEFFAMRLGVTRDALPPVMLAAAVGGILQAAQTRWFLQGGDLGESIAEGLEILERGFGAAPILAPGTAARERMP
jgi:AcrR family transcriptional regulator